MRKEGNTMKSMGNIYHRQQAYLRTKAGQQMMKKEADNIIRRNFAMVFKVLHVEGYTGVDLWKDDWMEGK